MSRIIDKVCKNCIGWEPKTGNCNRLFIRGAAPEKAEGEEAIISYEEGEYIDEAVFLNTGPEFSCAKFALKEPEEGTVKPFSGFIADALEICTAQVKAQSPDGMHEAIGKVAKAPTYPPLHLTSRTTYTLDGLEFKSMAEARAHIEKRLSGLIEVKMNTRIGDSILKFLIDNKAELTALLNIQVAYDEEDQLHPETFNLLDL